MRVNTCPRGDFIPDQIEQRPCDLQTINSNVIWIHGNPLYFYPK